MLPMRTSPPFRADHVGSLLRPDNLLAAREDLAAGRITAGQLREIEDEAIAAVVAMQRDVGLQSATDGEFRRASWHMDFIYQIGGVGKAPGNLAVKVHTPGGGIEFTPAGKLVFKYASRVLKQHEELKLQLSEMRAAVKAPSLTVGGSYSPSMALLPSLLARYRKSHPHIEVKLTTGKKDELERALRNSEIDVAIVNNPRPSRCLIVEPYANEPLVAFVSETHPLARKKTITPDDLVRFPLVIRVSNGAHGTTEQILNDLRNNRVRFEIAMRCDSPQAVKEAVRRNVGVGILFKTVVEADIRRGEFKKINLFGLELAGKTCIVYHKYKTLTPRAQKFLDILREQRTKRSRA